LRAGTRTAAKFGSGFGFVLIGLGLLQLFQGQLIGAIWSAVLGMFLRGVAQASYREVLFRRALEDKPVRYFMTEDPVTVSPELKLSPFVEDYLYRHHHKLYPVMEDGVLQGVVGPAEVRQVDRNEWNAVAVDRVMQRLDDVICLRPDAPAQTALERMQQSGRSRMLVVETGNGDTRLLGILTLKDLIAFLSLKMELEEGEEDADLQADIRG
ncbi:MAG: CBS domain-containing protein, partial [Opitutales bacterium]